MCETYSSLLDTPQKSLFVPCAGNAPLPLLSGRLTYERLGPDGMIALIFWGYYSYGTYDTRFMIERYVELDERWILIWQKIQRAASLR